MHLPIEYWKNTLGKLGVRVERRRVRRARSETRFSFEALEGRLVMSGDSPEIAGLLASPLSVNLGSQITLTASGVSDPNGDAVTQVQFFRDADNDGVLTGSDGAALGTDTDGSNGWSISVSTTGFPAGTNRFFAVATDTTSLDGDPVAATATVLLPAQIIDNTSSAGYSTGSSNYWSTSGGGYSGGHQFEFGATGGYAQWSFSGLPDGEYRVSATWLEGTNRGTNVPYTIYDGSLDVGTTRVNQRVAPAADVVVSSKNFQNLGSFSVVNGSLVVRMTNSSGDGRAIADAIRIQHLGPAQEASDIRVFDGSTELSDATSTVALGTAFIGTPTTPRTLTVKNVGLADLVLSPLTQANMPAGATLVASYGATTLARGESTTFQVQLAATSVGSVSGIVSLSSNDPDESAFDITMTGVVNGSKVIDNSSSTGYTTVSTGYWSNSSGGYSGGHQFEFGATGGYAQWTFSNLPAGQYRVSTTWLEGTNRGTNVPYAIYDGSYSLGAVPVNQQIAPVPNVVVGGTNFQDLGSFSVVNGSLIVRITNSSGDGRAIADAIRIEHLGAAQQTPEIRVFNSGTELYDNSSTVNLGTTFFGTPTTATTLTVTNSGSTGLVLAPLTQASMPTGVTLVSSYASATLAPGASTTFQVAITASAVGAVGGVLSLASNDADETAFDITLTGTVNRSKVIDNNDPGYSTVSSNYWSTTGGAGYSGGYQFEFGATGGYAQWSFPNLPAGKYRVSATWPEDSRWTTTAPYSIFDGSTAISTIVVNQKIPPSTDVLAGGRAFQDLGSFSVTNGSLAVQLAHLANKPVVADAIRLEYVRSLPEYQLTDQGPQLLINDQPVTAIDFGPSERTNKAVELIAVTNATGASITLTQLAQQDLPAGYLLLEGLGALTLAPGAQTYFRVQLDAITPGAYGGVIPIQAGAEVFQLPVTGAVISTPVLVDNSDPGFQATGTGWQVSSSGFSDDSRQAQGTAGANKATWTVDGLAPGEYLVFATHPASATSSPEARFNLYDGDVATGVLAYDTTIDQTIAPDDIYVAGKYFEVLGQIAIDSNTLTVELDASSAASTWSVADAIYVIPIGAGAPPTGVSLVATASFSNGVLDIVGSIANDVVTVSTVDIGGIAQVLINGQHVGAGLPASAVTMIVANLGSGDDTLSLSGLDLTKFSGLTDGSITLRGGAGKDKLTGASLVTTLMGEDGNDVLVGGAANDVLSGGAGIDTLVGSGGDDELIGGAGADTYVFAGSTWLGTDSIIEAANVDSDTIDFTGLGGAVTINLAITATQAGNASLVSLTLSDGAGIENVKGSAHADTIYGNSRANVLDGRSGNDTIYGRAGADQLLGDSGDDTLYGESGNDKLSGGAGNDLTFGGEGDDELTGFTGDDYVAGGTGNDVYVYGSEANLGDDTVAEAPGEGQDRLDLGAVAFAAPMRLNSTAIQPLNSGFSLQLLYSEATEWITPAKEQDTNQDIFIVPGAPGTTSELTFTYGDEEADYWNWVWVFEVGPDGTEAPGAQLTKLFVGNVNQLGDTKTVSFPAGTRLSFKLKQDRERIEYGYEFYAVPCANEPVDDAPYLDHVRTIEPLPGIIQYHWEDLSHALPNHKGFIYDNDFNDYRMSISAATAVGLSVTNAYAAESDSGKLDQPRDLGAFTFSRGEGNVTGDLIVTFVVGGSAEYGSDKDYTLQGYQTFNQSTREGTIRIPAGKSTAILTVTPVNDATSEWDETVEVDIKPTSEEGSTGEEPATVTILDNDGLQPLLSRNVDIVSTGLVDDRISNGTVSIGIEEGDARVVIPMAPAGAGPAYRSNDQLRPVATIEIKLPESVGQFQATLNIATGDLDKNGVLDDAPLTYIAQGNVDPSQTIRFVVLGDDNVADYLRTGHYDYDVEITVGYGEDKKVRTIRGETEVVNLVNANFGEAYFGKRWWVDSLDRLVPGDGTAARYVDKGLAARQGMALVRGDSTSAWYADKGIDVSQAAFLDRGDSDYEETGTWSDGTGVGGHAGAYRYAGLEPLTETSDCNSSSSPPSPEEETPSVKWTFRNLEEGRQYQLFVSYVPAWDRTEAAKYTVSGGTRIGSRVAGGVDNETTINQQYTPGEQTVDGVVWRSIGYYIVDPQKKLEIKLENGAEEGTLIADSVMLLKDWKYQTPDGSFNQLDAGQLNDTGGYYTGSLVPDPKEFSLLDKTGTRHVFNASGRLTRTIDRNENQSLVAYTPGGSVWTVTVQGGLAWTYQYVGSSLDKIVDYAGRVFDYTVSGGLLSSITSPNPDFGQSQVVTSFWYGGARSQLSAVIDGEGNVTGVEYDGTSERVNRVTNADDHQWTITPYLFDGVSNSSGEIFEPSSGAIGEFDNNSQAQATYTDPRQNVWTYQTDRFGLTTAKSAPGTVSTDGVENVWLWARNKHGLPTIAVEPAGAGGNGPTLGQLVTEFFYDNNSSHAGALSRGNLTKIVYPQNKQNGGGKINEQWTYNGTFSAVTSSTNGRGFTTTFVLDGFGNATSVLEPLNVSTQLEYTTAPASIASLPGGLVLKVSDPRGYLTTTEYYTIGDGATLSGLVKSVTRGTPDMQNPPEGPINWDDETTQRFEYDVNRNPAATIQEMGTGPSRRTDFVYDTLDRLVTVREPQAEIVSPSGSLVSDRPTTEYRYDAIGLVETMTDALGRITTYEYDEMGRLERTFLPQRAAATGTEKEERFYDENGNLIEVKNPREFSTKYAYDARNLLEKTTLPASPGDHGEVVTHFRYDTAGNLARMFDADGYLGATRQTEYQYDSLHRRTSETRPAPAAEGSDFATHGSPITQTVYDDNGNVVRIVEKNIQTTLNGVGSDRVTEVTFDALDRQTLVQRTSPLLTTLVPIYAVNEYDANGNVLRERDALNRETRHVYDGLNRLVETILPAAPVFYAEVGPSPTVVTTLKYAYNDASELISQTDQRNLTTTLGYDALGRNTSITQPTVASGTPLTVMQYDAVGNLRFVYDPNQSGLQLSWNRTEFEYDEWNQRVKTIGAAATALAFWIRPTTEVTYDSNGNQETVKDPNGNITSFEYDTHDRLAKITRPAIEGETTSVTQFRYSAAGNRTHVIDVSSNNRTTTTTYDNLDRPIIVEDPTGRVSRTYYLMGDTVGGTDEAYGSPDLLKTSYDRDDWGRVEWMRQVRGTGITENTFFRYDNVGNLLSVQDPAANVTEYEYDALNRRSSETQNGVGTREYGYDENGNLVHSKDRNDRVVRYAYDALNRRMSETWLGDGANGYLATYAYDLAGNLLTASDGQGTGPEALSSSISTIYDNLYRPLWVTQAATHLPETTLAYGHDLNGNRTSTQFLVEGVVDHANVYTYDALNRVTLVRQFDPANPSGSATVRPKAAGFWYQPDSQIAAIHRYETYSADPASYDGFEAVGKTTYTYEPTNTSRLKEITHLGKRPEGGERPELTRYEFTYDANSRVDEFTTREFASGVQTPKTVRRDHLYDGVGQLTGYTDYVDESTTGTTTTFNYDANGNPQGTVVGPHNRLMNDGVYVYTYDDEGNRTSRTRLSAEGEQQVAGSPVTGSGAWSTVNSGYGGSQRVGNTVISPPNIIPAEASWTVSTLPEGTYGVYATWAAIGSGTGGYETSPFTITTENSSGESSSSQSANMNFYQAPPADFSYDGTGWVLIGSVTSTGTTTVVVSLSQGYVILPNGSGYFGSIAADAILFKPIVEQTTYEWDHRNRLVSVTTVDAENPMSSNTTHFEYDVFNRRVRKESTGFYQEDNRYINDGSHVALVAGYDEAIDRRYLWAPGVDQLLADEVVEAGPTNIPILWPLADHQGSVKDVFGTGYGESEYRIHSQVGLDAFGKPTNPMRVAFLYAGQEYDFETGLQYSRARYYDPAAKQFISQDPIGFAGGDTNLYRRVGNSPINATDPSGNRASFWDDPLEWGYGSGGAIWDVGASQSGLGSFYRDSFAEGIRGTLGDQYLASAGGWELVGVATAGATAGVLAGWAAIPAAGALGLSGAGAAVFVGGVGGGAEYLAMTGTAAGFNAAYGYGANVGPTWSGLGTSVAFGALTGGVLHGAGMGIRAGANGYLRSIVANGGRLGESRLSQRLVGWGVADSIAPSGLIGQAARQGSGKAAGPLAQRLEANAARRLAELEADAGPKAHFFSRHGAHTTIEKQYDRALTGLAPDGFAGKIVDSSRFLSHRAQLNAVQAAQEIYLRTGKRVFTFDAGYEIGEGFLKNGTDLVRTTNVRVVFDTTTGKIQTMFPWLSALP